MAVTLTWSFKFVLRPGTSIIGGCTAEAVYTALDGKAHTNCCPLLSFMYLLHSISLVQVTVSNVNEDVTMLLTSHRPLPVGQFFRYTFDGKVTHTWGLLIVCCVNQGSKLCLYKEFRVLVTKTDIQTVR